jgi:aerobic carbon-monoxide dehydrogenase small subunit
MRITLKVNGHTEEADAKPNRLLVHFLREDLGLTGTHVGCVEGVCGCCTVLVDGKPTKSCLMFAVQADGREVVTVESLARDGQLNELQKSFQENFALQCGYCTPGMLMSATALLSENRKLSDDEIKKYMLGNLCRCTGYIPIVKAIKQAQERKE